MRYQLVLQWNADSISDYDALIQIEDFIIKCISDESEVDGHDVGSGEMNIFILTGTPEQDFFRVQELLASSAFVSPARAAFREIGMNDYKVIWPIGGSSFSVL